MKHEDPHGEFIELAAGYALGALTQHEARSFEGHLNEGCEACILELSGFEEVTLELALAAPEAEPTAATLGKLLEMTAKPMRQEATSATTDKPTKIPVSIRADEGGWDQVAEGILVKQLFVDETSGTMTSLVRMAAGNSLPPHRHKGIEQFFILEGDCNINGDILGPGDYHRAEIGSVHHVTATEHGTLFLLVAPASYEELLSEI